MKLEDQEKKGGLFSKFLQPKQRDSQDDSDARTEESGVPSVQSTPFTPTPRPVEDLENTWRGIPAFSTWEGKRRLELQVNKATTKARLLLRAPDKDETETFTMEILRQVLEKCHIVFGVDEEALQSFFISPPNTLLYNTNVIIATGIPSVDGVDGSVKEFFERTNKPHFDERPDGTIDFKNMHTVNNVSKGTVICEIINPIQGTIGTSIYNKPIRPRTAKSPSIPRGENVDLVTIDESSSNLVAAIDGNLIYKNQRFCVEHTFRVNGDVDNSIGNINFTGNVVVTGDVCEGYSIKTNRDVTVYGIVEGASIYAGGEIQLEKGINGMSKGILEAQKGITAKFIENCTVRSGDRKSVV